MKKESRPQKKGIFIAGTDTGVGKTWVTCALAKAFKKNGLRVAGLKPFQSGSWEDSQKIKRATKSSLSLNQITPFYFRHPLAPYSSLQIEKKSIQPQKIKSLYEPIIQTHDLTLIEGVGGALVPITHNFFCIDIPKLLNIPTLLVARLSLGTLNHTLLTIEAFKKRNLKIKGIILNAYPIRKKDLACQTNPSVLKKIGKIPILGILPYPMPDDIEKHIDMTKILC